MTIGELFRTPLFRVDIVLTSLLRKIGFATQLFYPALLN